MPMLVYSMMPPYCASLICLTAQPHPCFPHAGIVWAVPAQPRAKLYIARHAERFDRALEAEGKSWLYRAARCATQ